MAHSVIHLTQSRYYSPAFNAAVFDGPIRIYFAQHQETLALQVYFQMQQHLQGLYANFRKSFKQHGQTIFLMLYPGPESFANSFAQNAEACGRIERGVPPAAGEKVIYERLGEDHVVGVCGPLTDSEYSEVFARVKAILLALGVTPDPLPDRSFGHAECAAP